MRTFYFSPEPIEVKKFYNFKEVKQEMLRLQSEIQLKYPKCSVFFMGYTLMFYDENGHGGTVVTVERDTGKDKPYELSLWELNFYTDKNNHESQETE